MILAPIMINQTTIGAIYARRLEPLEKGRDTYHYEWEVTLEGGPTPTHRAGGGLTHNYSDGALVLIQKILDLATLKVDR